MQFIVGEHEGGWHWRLVGDDGRSLACSPAPLATRDACLAAINSVQGSWCAPVYTRVDDPTGAAASRRRTK